MKAPYKMGPEDQEAQYVAHLGASSFLGEFGQTKRLKGCNARPIRVASPRGGGLGALGVWDWEGRSAQTSLSLSQKKKKRSNSLPWRHSDILVLQSQKETVSPEGRRLFSKRKQDLCCDRARYLRSVAYWYKLITFTPFHQG